ncbi:MAG: leucine-rich repeat protein, partial [Lachnospiraceae bacterium]|nr:leucine-rich repeat protein [Lachnospiraceae bacterium]
DEITAVEIEGATSDLGNVFYNMPELQSAKLPGQLNISKTTGYFYNCPKLETLSIEKCQYEVKNGNVLVGSVKKYGNTVLLGTKTATELPSDVQRIGGRAFYGQSLPYIKIPSNVKNLASGAFEDCKQLTFIVIEPNKPTFEGDPFIGCDNLTDVYYSGDQKTWNTISKKSKVLQKAKVHCGETAIPELVTVSFDCTGGDQVDSIQVIKGNTIKSLPVTYKEQYVLDGWYQDAGLTTPFEANKDKVDAGMTLYAKWRNAEQYSVKFYSKKDENGQWILVEDQPVYEQMYATAPNVSGEADEQLVGWYIDEKYQTGFSLTQQRIKTNLSLYARWTKLTVLPEKTVTVTVKEEEVNISYTVECTTEVTYDGRKHIVGELDGQTFKNAKSTAAVNPDIAVANLTVLLNGEIVTGISIQKFTYKNNKLPSNDGVNTKEPNMYIYPVLKYDKNDEGLKQAIQTCPQFKKTLNAMMKPSYKKMKNEDDEEGEPVWGWTNGCEPITVTIKRIDLTGVQVYTNDDLKADQKLKVSDNILVWKGKKFSRVKKKVGKGEDAVTYCTKTTIPQLCYQKVIDVNGKPKVKKLPLRPGAWKIAKRFTWEQDENDKWRKVFDDEPSPIINSTAFDYYFDTDEGTSPSLNTDAGAWVEYDKQGNEIYKVRCGYFDGSLPSIEEQTDDDE